MTVCHYITRGKRVCIISAICTLMLGGCATVTVPGVNGAEPAVVKCFGCKVSVPAGSGNIVIDQSEPTVAAGERVLTKAAEVGGAAFANRVVDKAAEAQGKP